jgi:hypothetical protein
LRCRIAFLILCLLAPPLLAATSSTAPLVRAGRVEVDADPAALSFLPVDTGVLKDILCSGSPSVHDWDTVTPRGECDLSVSPPPRLGFFASDSRPGDGSLQVSLQPAGWDVWLGSAPVDTACGLWEVSMILDSGKEQPVSQLALAPSPIDPAQGVFAGEAQLAVRYRFVDRDLGTSLEIPAMLSLELSGHWAAVPADGPSLGDGVSNLVLYAGAAGGEWSAFPTCGTWGGTRCPVCLTPGPDVLETLSSKSPALIRRN